MSLFTSSIGSYLVFVAGAISVFYCISFSFSCTYELLWLIADYFLVITLLLNPPAFFSGLALGLSSFGGTANSVFWITVITLLWSDYTSISSSTGMLRQYELLLSSFCTFGTVVSNYTTASIFERLLWSSFSPVTIYSWSSSRSSSSILSNYYVCSYFSSSYSSSYSRTLIAFKALTSTLLYTVCWRTTSPKLVLLSSVWFYRLYLLPWSLSDFFCALKDVPLKSTILSSLDIRIES